MAVYSSFDDCAHVRTAVSLGVETYITKRRSAQELENALLQALSGKKCIDEAAHLNLVNTNSKLTLLTRREMEVLTLVKQKKSNKEIAAELVISHRTVENILSCVYDKTGLRSRYELELL
jgi:DNA-binding NarL/FixJ family response regulator